MMKKKRVKERATFSCIFSGPPPFPPVFRSRGGVCAAKQKKGRRDFYAHGYCNFAPFFAHALRLRGGARAAED